MIDSLLPHTYGAVLAELRRRLKEPAPGRVQVLSGPRQVGKTHLLRVLEREYQGRCVYAAADSSAAALPGWWEAQWRAAEAIAREAPPALLLLDEVQYLAEWSRRLKAEHDRVAQEELPIHVAATGSSSLLLGRGARETMAGRFEQLRLLHWPAQELVLQFGLSETRAVTTAVSFGTYPGAMTLLDDLVRHRAYLRDAIVEPAIGRDIMALEVIRKPALLRQVFAVAVGHPAEIVSLAKIRGRLADLGALETIAHYLEVLSAAYLIAAVPKFSPRTVRQRSAPPKLVALNQALLWATALTAPQPDSDSLRWSRWVENACIAHAWSAGQSVWYWRQEPLEVDLVMSGSWGSWAVEVTTGTLKPRDAAGLFELTRRYPDYRPLLLVAPGQEGAAASLGVPSQTWQQFLLGGPPI